MVEGLYVCRIHNWKKFSFVVPISSCPCHGMHLCWVELQSRIPDSTCYDLVLSRPVSFSVSSPQLDSKRETCKWQMTRHSSLSSPQHTGGNNYPASVCHFLCAATLSLLKTVQLLRRMSNTVHWPLHTNTIFFIFCKLTLVSCNNPHVHAKIW